MAEERTVNLWIIILRWFDSAQHQKEPLCGDRESQPKGVAKDNRNKAQRA